MAPVVVDFVLGAAIIALPEHQALFAALFAIIAASKCIQAHNIATWP